MKKIISFIFLLITMNQLIAQGQLLLIGGGSESDSPGAWNHDPYSRAVQESVNKRVAVISYYNESSWIPDYFMNHCGATFAKNFKINTPTIANAQETYDSLLTYDVIFLKGGDQYNYYDTWKNTLTQQAFQAVFDNGGVICGTSAGLAVMSEVLFTAQNGTVYPDEMLEDPFNQYAHLADDFLQLFPGYIFDSHFADRGRLPRLAGFLANWEISHGELVKGVGVDENTAMFIDSSGLGTVYGTGAVTVLQAPKPNSFSLQGNMLRADSLLLRQLIDGCTYDFQSGQTSGLAYPVAPYAMDEGGSYQLFLSGGEALNQNITLLSDFIQQFSVTDTVILFTGSGQSAAAPFRTYLQNQGLINVLLRSAIGSTADDPILTEEISDASGFLFVGSYWYIFANFLQSGQAGQTLYWKLREEGMVSAFIGDNSRFAGTVIIDNYLMNNASGSGDLDFRPGLGLLTTTAIIPRIYDDPDMYENPVTGIPYAMVFDSLRNGILLSKRNYIHYFTKGDRSWLKVHGTLPVVLFRNIGTVMTQFTSATYSASSSTVRNIVGFEEMQFSILADGDSLMTGAQLAPAGIEPVHAKLQIKLRKIPGENSYVIENPAGATLNIFLVDVQGRWLWEGKTNHIEYVVRLRGYPSGTYVLNVQGTGRVSRHSFKLFALP